MSNKEKQPATTGSGKGDWQRPVDKKKYDKNYERIFKKRKGKRKQ